MKHIPLGDASEKIMNIHLQDKHPVLVEQGVFLQPVLPRDKRHRIGRNLHLFQNFHQNPLLHHLQRADRRMEFTHAPVFFRYLRRLIKQMLFSRKHI